MARFRSTPTRDFGFTPSYGQRRDFSPPGLKAGSYTFGGEAAGMVSLADTYSAASAGTRPDELITAAQEMRRAERDAVADATASTFANAYGAFKGIESAKDYRDMMNKQAGATKKAGIFSALGTVAGAALPFVLSDETTKHTIERIDDALASLRQLKPVSFYYKEEYSTSPERMHYGFIAQDYKNVMPDATYYDESIGKLCIDTGELIGLLVRANQQLETRIARLEAKEALTAV
jgi:hypothetical protein